MFTLHIIQGQSKRLVYVGTWEDCNRIAQAVWKCQANKAIPCISSIEYLPSEVMTDFAVTA